MTNCLTKNYGEEYLSKYVKELGDGILINNPSSYNIFLTKLINLKTDYYFTQDINDIQNCVKTNNKGLSTVTIVFLTLFCIGTAFYISLYIPWEKLFKKGNINTKDECLEQLKKNIENYKNISGDKNILTENTVYSNNILVKNEEILNSTGCNPFEKELYKEIYKHYF